MKLQIYRTNASSYQSSKFLSKEQRVLEEVEGVKYIQSLKEMDDSLPFILITNTHSKPEEISQNILDNTVLMVHPNSGHDNICKEFVLDSTFPIIIGNPIRANAVAEYTLSCLFQHYTKIPHHQHWSETREWDRGLLRDQKVLILGHGHIGKILNQSLTPLCREVKVYDPFAQKSELNTSLITEWDESIFDDVSVLLVAASLNPTSYQMIDHKVLKRLSPNCTIINPARGEIIKEIDLVPFLQKNPKSFCFLDVFEKEPFKPGHLNEVKNLNKTSHIAGVYEKLNNDIISFEYIVINDFMKHFNSDNISNFHQDYQECLLTEELFLAHE
jgi:D-3-phosphoglycerate dehydrogenase